jgi:hypothetical protein
MVTLAMPSEHRGLSYHGTSFPQNEAKKAMVAGKWDEMMACDGQNVVLTSVLDLGPSRPVDARPLPPALIVSVA